MDEAANCVELNPGQVENWRRVLFERYGCSDRHSVSDAEIQEIHDAFQRNMRIFCDERPTFADKPFAKMKS
jgi:hypothetical protein